MTSPPSEPVPTNTDSPLQADPEYDDDDSAFGDQISTFTSSVTSSVLDYPVEHGRRYHAYKAGAYPMPNDDLYMAPIDAAKVQKILDLGTGTGIWAMEMGDLLPQAEIIGNDLSAVQPTRVPPNVKFEIDDVESPWLYNEPFDYIFSRYMAGSILNWPTYINNIYDNLAPGGWAEFQDYDGKYHCDDGSLTDEHSTKIWIDGLHEAGLKLGRDPRPGGKIEGWVKDAGFQNVVHQRYKFPIGPWAKDPQLKTVGMWNIAQVLEGLEAFSLRLYCDVLGWDEKEVVVLLAKVRKELTSGKLHCYVNFHVVYGQR
ncbi:methyltransferase domain-containing protein [Stachybotrys elegans]|uniref:Methyltransferase domain-containing protein n=1 Tax=Stachybotrys elegans TaxID=80388 RepID=A0A8K0SPH5_9HYPO|nr:methyltransferase domain-containing protein [Stachybotrys elegans]